jgi:hypothetical protein
MARDARRMAEGGGWPATRGGARRVVEGSPPGVGDVGDEPSWPVGLSLDQGAGDANRLPNGLVPPAPEPIIIWSSCDASWV